MAITMPQFRPINIGVSAEWWEVWKYINWKWLLQRIPMLLFAIVSSYGVGHFLELSGLPSPFYQLGGISFDIGFLGVIALADMQLKKTIWNKIAYYLLNGSMSGLAALFNVLSHADGKYTYITPEAITAGVPFAIIGLCFALYYETVMSSYIEKEEQLKEEEKKEAEKTAYKCKYCGEGKVSQAAVYGHYKTCMLRATHTNNPGKDTCKCLLCQADK